MSNIGFTGSTGSTGQTGFSGSNGPTGYQGPIGPIGLTGYQGIQGITGLQGIAGTQGNTGITGEIGITGITGDQGPIGSLNGIGSTGSIGEQGYVGFQGNLGITGEIGIKGPQGQTINIGLGPTGFSGAIGYTGYTGFTGNTGPTGLTQTGIDVYYNSNELTQFSNFGISINNFGNEWSPITYGNTAWQSVSLSESGQYQTAVVGVDSRGYIYTSNDYGLTWSAKVTDKLGDWWWVSISSTGQYQTAVSLYDYIFISDDFGNTWNQVLNERSGGWTSISVSSSGQFQTATIYSNIIYISNDYGKTWKSISVSGSITIRFWCVAISSTSQYQTAGSENGYLYVSNDFGNTWTPKITDTQRNWYDISISASGQYQTAVSYRGILSISSDFGNTWKTILSSPSVSLWSGVSISASGQYQCASIYNNGAFLGAPGNGQIHVSTDYGNTWDYKYTPNDWSSISISGSGQYITATTSYASGFGNYVRGRIYICNSGLGPIGPAGVSTDPYFKLTGIPGFPISTTQILNAESFSDNSLSLIGFLNTTGLKINNSGSVIFPSTVSTPNPATIIDFQNLSLGLYNISMSSNITSFTFSNGLNGGQYTIYVSNTTGETLNIGPFASSNSLKTNFSGGILNVPNNGNVILNVTYWNSIYFLSGTNF